MYPPDIKPYTGTWFCPLCPAHIPVTLYGRTEDGEMKLIPDSPCPRADVYLHIWSEHPDGV